MAVYSNSVSVNNGNTNWTRAQVLQSLETVFANLGFHGAAESGVLSGLTAPQNGWNQVGGTVSGLPSSFCYYLYEAPTSGGRKGGAFQVIRYGSDFASNSGKVYQVNLVGRCGTGWSNNQAFTIPGTATGGTSPANDITFGVNAAAVPSIVASASSFGSSSTWFDSETSTDNWAVLKCVNDSAKTYGTTYYGFRLTNDYTMYISSGNSWNPVNNKFNGYGGLDILSSSGTAFDVNQGDITSYAYTQANTLSYASSSSPTQYPLTIRYWRAQSPQDTNFAVISFVQSIKGNTKAFGGFTAIQGKDSSYLPYYYEYNSEGILMRTHTLGSSSNEGPPNVSYGLAKESLYGYFRGESGSSMYSIDRYDTNIRYNTADNTDPKLYYRNSSLDSITENGVTVGVSSSADYYRVLKGIPLSNTFIPCPYYLPDDYVLIQFDTVPGLAEFYSGDTVTITAGSEVYTVIESGYVQNQSSNTRTRGVLFCARTT
jgi:hypothetical protein